MKKRKTKIGYPHAVTVVRGTSGFRLPVSCGRRFLPSAISQTRLSFRAKRGFTLVELLMAMTISSIVFGACLAGIVGLQHAYAATEQYATNLADQTRLLDSICMDLRRALSVRFDADQQGMMITLPDFYNYNKTDAQFSAPLPNLPRVPDDHSRAVYTSTTSDPNRYASLPAPAVYYRFNFVTKAVSREELPPAVPAMQQATNKPPVTTNSVYGQRILASSLQGFPLIQLRDGSNNPLGNPNTTPAAGQTPLQASITVCFKPIFSTVSTPDTNLVRLHGRVFLRNNDLRSR